MRNDIYRHSAWIDVFGVLLFGAVLLGGAGYLLAHMGRVAGPPGGSGAIVSEETRSVSPRPSPGPLARRPGPGSGPGPGSTPTAGRRAAFPSGRSDVGVPFSESWQEQATPELSGPSGPSSSPPGGGAQGGEAAPAPSSGPAIASRTPTSGTEGGTESGAARGGGGTAGSSWRAEAQRLSGQARALSNELGQMARSAPRKREGGKTSSREPSAESATSTGASSNDRDVPDPPNVPIDDHLHWLLVAGVLWGTWRLWRG